VTRRPLPQVALDALALGALAAVCWWLAYNTSSSLASRGISVGFEFLDRPANFEIGDTPIEFTPEQSIRRAITVGLVNTARVSIAGWILSTALGFLLGVARLSTNPLLRGSVRRFVEAVRSIPLLLLLLLLAATMHALPSARSALEPLPGVFVSDRGLVLPYPSFFPLRWNVPALDGFNFTGGLTLSPEFTALLAALVLHHAAIVSEIVRGAILAVPRGQQDAAHALGLSRAQAMRLVIVPQALRAMVPLLASSAVSLTKNSSLAVAIGFPDVVSILNTTSNQTGHALETMLLMIVMYLGFSLVVAALLNAYNARLMSRVARPAR
jgi:general L-amino acid transport system permease protein